MAKLCLLTIVPRVFSVISLPQINHFIFDEIGETRAQNDTAEPFIATTGTGSLINVGIDSRITSFASRIIISHDVVQQPYSEAIIHV